ncbi:hypothetical protein [Sporosalibacterium faouarense]|uniref:hypothetical protein n=1 Tax=Sporosalibacterium faouarense TaxID=516123 RepID=UPI00141D6A53|nr:hypothetical protein [Sporosalibacterium faouarense]MTI47933.1 hypothetical protein [Bacillota bacterium]
MKRKFLIVVILLITAFMVKYINISFTENASFSELVLEKYKEKDFNEILIDKEIENGNYDIRKSEENSDIDKIIKHFNDLKLEELRENEISKIDGYKYEIKLHNTKTHEYLNIGINDKKTIRIIYQLMRKDENKSKNLTVWKHKRYIKYYRIQDDEVNLSYIEKVYQGMNALE